MYDPLSSGVYWDVQDTILEDIERIEVIRGPGATLWGANAVNGVVNIISKKERPFRAIDIAQFISQIVHGMGALGIGVRLLQSIHFMAGIRIW